ncbi:unnamed protein product [Caretta caretta]
MASYAVGYSEPGTRPKPNQPLGKELCAQLYEWVGFDSKEKQALLSDLPELKRDNKNAEFWDKLDGLAEIHGLHRKDVHTLVKCKCPRDAWDSLEDKWKTGHWAEDHNANPAGGDQAGEPAGTPNPEAGSVTEFRTALSAALGAQTSNWGALQSVVQQEGESATSYAEKKWNAFRAYSGLENIASPDHDVFLQIRKEGLSADHQAVLALGISVGETYSAVMKWATEVENRKKRKVAATTPSEEITAVHRIKTTTCFTCNKPGHLARKQEKVEEEGLKGDQDNQSDHGEAPAVAPAVPVVHEEGRK